MAVKIPRLVIAGISGDSGKTVVTLSILTALNRMGLSVAPFKKGPDYIDAAWHTAVSGNQCRNLDIYLTGPDQATKNFGKHARKCDIAVIEGNRGLFDGLDAEGKYSTSELAKTLRAPVVLIINVTKTTRTVAALLKGCIDFDPDVKIAGVILNRVAGKRHETVIKESIEKYCGIPVLGAIPKLGSDDTIIPGRHLGLITPAEFKSSNGFLSKLDEIAEKYLAIDKLIEIARNTSDYEYTEEKQTETKPRTVNIGFFNDSVFTFYYPENLEALEQAGANLIPVSSISDQKIPENIDAFYIGGGFPETQAEKLTANRAMMESIKQAVDDGLPVYAECGGLIYLSNSIIWKENEYKMAGVFPVDLKMNKKPAGHGYSLLKVKRGNPFYKVGQEIKGHEFHYSSPLDEKAAADACCLEVIKGAGVALNMDGLCKANCLAVYTHIHAQGNLDWARAFVAKAEEIKKKRVSPAEKMQVAV